MIKKILSILLPFFILLFSFEANAQYKRTNLGPNINTKDGTEAEEIISPDGKTFYFRRAYDSEGDYDIYYSKLGADDKWGPAIALEELNNSSVNAVHYIYPDGNKMIVSGEYYGKDGLFESVFSDGKWGAPVRLTFENEFTEWEYPGCSLSADQKVMLLTNHTDIYVSFSKGERLWSQPVALKDVNTGGAEVTVFLASDNRTIYFSSNGYKTRGEKDVFKSTRLNDTWLNWSVPEALDETINSVEFETFFRIHPNGKMAYLYMLKDGNGDLYSVPLSEKNKPPALPFIKGKITNSKNSGALKAEIKLLDPVSKKEIAIAVSDSLTGDYSFAVPASGKYELSVANPGFQAYIIPVEVKLATVEQNVDLLPLEKGSTIVLANIFFDPNQFELLPQSFFELDMLVKTLKENPAMTIEVSGHTSRNSEGEKFNVELSSNRALAVKNYLVKNGIEAGRVSSKGFGYSKPIFTEADEEHQQKNRRVEFSILTK